MANDNERTEQEMAKELGVASNDSGEAVKVTQEMEKMLEPGLMSSGSSPKGQKKTTQKSVQNSDRKDTSPDNKSEKEVDYEKRYKDSSKEAKKLKQRVKEYDKYAPLIDAMKQDPNLINHVKSYFESGGQAPGNLKEQLGLGEDFIYDADEAFSDQNSDSAKLFRASIDNIVQSRIAKAKKDMEQKVAMKSQEQQFKEKHDLTDEQFREMKEWAQDKKTDYEDIYHLWQKATGQYDQKVENQAKEDVMNQMKNVQQRPDRAKQKSSQSSQEDKSIEDQVFDAMLGLDDDVGDAFGI